MAHVKRACILLVLSTNAHTLYGCAWISHIFIIHFWWEVSPLYVRCDCACVMYRCGSKSRPRTLTWSYGRLVRSLVRCGETSQNMKNKSSKKSMKLKRYILHFYYVVLTFVEFHNYHSLSFSNSVFFLKIISSWFFKHKKSWILCSRSVGLDYVKIFISVCACDMFVFLVE